MTRLRDLIVAAFRVAVANKKTLSVATALGLAVVAYGIWFDWEWKAMIGWKALEGYINPKNATGRKDAVQVYALIVAGVVAAITAAVGLSNLRLTRRNLEQQQKLEDQRAEHERKLAQGTALQAYYEQIGTLITEHELRTTKREDILALALSQTLTVLRQVNGNGKGSLLTFLHGASLIGTLGREERPPVWLSGADLQNANLQNASLQGANLQGAKLESAKLVDTDLQWTTLKGADLRHASLWGADCRKANFSGAKLGDADIENTDFSESNITAKQLDVAAPMD